MGRFRDLDKNFPLFEHIRNLGHLTHSELKNICPGILKHIFSQFF
ncbi:Uncharacterized protein dnm_091900 [Desulfonema magnum]|uniref:Uncharacterized protein n=1 Tax=Desulfonema magnum TaxID=45655 RepID=A0A975BXG9_9BACT|nr:Uncharacterized protein dnm_091900 [Desulfonema magnum]